MLALPCRTARTVCGLPPCLLAKSSHSGFLYQNTALARLAVLVVLSTARRLVFWQSRAAIDYLAFKKAARNPVWIGRLQAGARRGPVYKGSGAFLEDARK